MAQRELDVLGQLPHRTLEVRAREAHGLGDVTAGAMHQRVADLREPARRSCAVDAVEGAELVEVLSAAGEIVDAFLPVDRETGRPRGFAFVTFATPEQASECVAKFNGQMVGGRSMNVNPAVERPRDGSGPRPGGFGGGGGGGGRGGYGGGPGGGGGGYGGGGGGYGGGGRR